jgi:hypothetical protein
MKTTTPEILCDACKKVIPVMHPTAIFVTLKGPKIGHKKADLCDEECLAVWSGILYGNTLPKPDQSSTIAAAWKERREGHHPKCSESEPCHCWEKYDNDEI